MVGETVIARSMRPLLLLPCLLLASCATLSTPDTRPLAHARAAAQAGQLRVTVIGESIAEGGNAAPGLSWPDQWRTQLQVASPGVTFENRALGRRRSAEYLNAAHVGLLAEPEDFRAGYGPQVPGDRPWVVTGQTWRAATQATRPDLFVIGMGLNEAWLLEDTALNAEQWKANLRAIIQDARTWTPAPDIVLMTSILPSREGVPGWGVIPAERISAVAQVTREVAAQEGLELVDVHRAWSVALGLPDPVSGEVRGARFTERELLGVWPGTPDGSDGGGNGYNHPTHLGSREVIVPAFARVMGLLRPR